MEIHYLYIEKYINLEKLPLKFSSKFNFKTTQQNGQIKIEIEKNPDYIESFFNDENTLNVSAIVGKNGSGKSNVLDFIKNSFPRGTSGAFEPIIIAYTVNKKHKIIIDTSLVVIIDDKQNNFTIENLNKRQLSAWHTLPNKYDDFASTTFIYYSNIVDSKIPSNLTRMKIFNEEESKNYHGIHNISTMALFGSDKEVVDPKGKLGIDKLDAYKAREIIRNLELITSNKNDVVKFQLPEEIYITIQDIDNQSLKLSNRFEFVYNKLAKYNGELFDENYSSPGMFFFNRILYAVILNILRTDLEMSTVQTYTEIFHQSEGETLHKFTLNFISKLKIGFVKDFRADFFKEKAFALERFIDFIFESLVKRNENLIGYEEKSFIIPLNQNVKFNAIEFFELYSKVRGLSDFLIFRFRNISSGQQSLLSLFSRFYHISNNTDLTDNLIILIDEGDVYFHPEWQRTYFRNVLSFIQQIFSGKKIQFIFTSNSPFIISDLPKQNVVFLDFDETSQKTVIKKYDDLDQTFGANIYELYKESFFMEKGFIGEFAKSKIEHLFNELIKLKESEQTITQKDYIKLLKRIEIIGDRIIKIRLSDILSEIPHEKSENEIEAEKLELKARELRRKDFGNENG